MTPLLSKFFQLKLETEDPEERFITSGVSWQAYESLLKSLENSSGYRVAYLLGTLEIMAPNRNHELDKKAISRLLEAYLEENRINFWGLGSTTFRKRDQQVGKEPDECYCIETDKDLPDLAIEVIYTSGGVDILEIYRCLGVGEVWLWQNQQFRIYCLQDSDYQQQQRSQLLPDLDIALLTQYVVMGDPLAAVIEWRQQLRAK
ncbi:MAG: Uma2 family endonuclease [Cyanobacteria bacterium J06621_8]